MAIIFIGLMFTVLLGAQHERGLLPLGVFTDSSTSPGLGPEGHGAG